MPHVPRLLQMSNPSIVTANQTAIPGSGDLVQGPEVTPHGIQYRTWTEHPEVTLIIYTADGKVARTLPMEAGEDGFFSVTDGQGKVGDLYKYQLGATGPFPDPASRFQPSGVHGPSMVTGNDFDWTDEEWQRPRLRDLAIYELHIGTFTREGTFTAAVSKLRHITEIGFNAIEIMPIGDFAGNRNWGYDGVSIYAPARVYGTPDEFRHLINAAHAHGLVVILDAVYNHFGPSGNYLGAFHRGYFHHTHKTPWGAAFNFGRAPVRDFFVQNVAYWMDEFHVDGFRLDATHAIVDSSDVHVLTEISAAAQERGGFVIAEDERNDPLLVTDPEHGGTGLDGCWADDFHHVVNVMLTGSRDAYFKNFQGTADELSRTLSQGWLFTGQVQPTSGKPRGADPSSLRPEQLIYCISNHDQVGNRALGDRLSHLITPAAYRAASALVLLTPYTPLIFMGQEWAASSPFQYFTDHEPDLGKKIIVGRRREFRDFAAFRDPTVRESIPSPQAAETFQRSKLNWNERHGAAAQAMLELYRTCIDLRNTVPALQDRSRGNWRVVRLGTESVGIVYGDTGRNLSIVIADLTGAGIRPEHAGKELGVDGELKVVFSSNEKQFSGECSAPGAQPETMLLQIS
jgi:maltooligosyltrehalose trehalohydrolase